MTKNDLNQFRGVVKEEIKTAINTALKPVVKKLDALWDQTVELTEDMFEVQQTLENHSKTLGNHTKALNQIAANTERNKEDVFKLDKRVHELENYSGIIPPPELTIAR